MAEIKAVNPTIRTFSDGKNIFFADFGNVFLENDASLSTHVMRDLLRFSPKEYEMWADAMDPCRMAFLNGEIFIPGAANQPETKP